MEFRGSELHAYIQTLSDRFHTSIRNCLFILLFILIFFVSSCIYVIGFANTTDYQQFLNEKGGLIFNNSISFLDLKPTAITFSIMLLAPYTISVFMYLLDSRTHLFGSYAAFLQKFSLAFILISLSTASTVIMLDMTDFTVKLPNYDTVAAWMNDRYGFEPYGEPNWNELFDGKVLYPNDTNFPVRDVYLKETDGAYYLIDGITQQELPVKN